MLIEPGFGGVSDRDDEVEVLPDDYSDVHRLPPVQTVKEGSVEAVRERLAKVIPLRSTPEFLPTFDPVEPFSEFEMAALRKEKKLEEKTLQLLDDLELMSLVVGKGQFSFVSVKELVKIIFDSLVAANDSADLSKEVSVYVNGIKDKYVFGGPEYLAYLKKLRQLHYLLRAWAS